jgi:parvulin-like peptidyl-prolyl isomerase
MKPKATPGQQAGPSKRQLSRWEKEWKRRRILAVVVALVIVAVVGVLVYGYYDTHYKPWHQPIVKVNGQVFDMRYYVKTLRFYKALSGAEQQDTSQDVQLAQYLVEIIQGNELVRQKAEDFDIDVNDITEAEIEEEIKSQFSFDPDGEVTLDEFNQYVEDFLELRSISRSDFEKLYIKPIILQNKLLEAMGNNEYPRDEPHKYVQVKAILLGTKEDAWEARDIWDEGIEQLVEDYSVSEYYPKDSVEWLPLGIEKSATFEDYAFDEESVGSGVSEPIHDTTYSTKGGYWLVEVLETSGDGDSKELHIQGILLDSNEMVNKVKSEIVGGGDFAELAKEYSLHSASKDNGGDMGLLDQSSVESQFGADNLDNILALEPGKLSEPLPAETSKQSGYWVIEVLDTAERELTDNDWKTLSQDAFNNWFTQESASGKEEGRIKDYILNNNERILWALDHI